MPQEGKLFSENVRRLAQGKQLTLKALAELADVRHDWLRRVVSKGLERSGSYNDKHIQRLATALGVASDDLWKEPTAEPVHNSSVLSLFRIRDEFERFRRQTVRELLEPLLMKFGLTGLGDSPNRIGPILSEELEGMTGFYSSWSHDVSDVLARAESTLKGCKAWQERYPEVDLCQTTFGLEILMLFGEREDFADRTAAALSELKPMLNFFGTQIVGGKLVDVPLTLTFGTEQREISINLTHHKRMGGKIVEPLRTLIEALIILRLPRKVRHDAQRILDQLIESHLWGSMPLKEYKRASDWIEALAK